jgi:hypothetical protein
MANNTNTKRIEALESRMDDLSNKLDRILGVLEKGSTVGTNGRGSAVAETPKDLELTKEQKAIVKKWKPTHSKGTDAGSINKCLRGCAYEFCGGKDKYNEKLYTLGKKAWFTAYNKDFRAKLPETK